jgi:prepilin signal peptidase PulO-like enzyme (type II secretory pathway)
MYLLRMVGKKLFGRHRLVLPQNSKAVLTTTGLVLPDKEIPYEDIFYRSSDQIEMRAVSVELDEVEGDAAAASRSFRDVSITINPKTLAIGDHSYDPEKILRVEIYTNEITLPRETVGLGLVKLGGLIGSFLGWQGVLFTLVCGGLASILSAFGVIAMGTSDTDRSFVQAASPRSCCGFSPSSVWIKSRMIRKVSEIAPSIAPRLTVGK